MGSYGIGVSRLVGGIIEASHDDRGIIWPRAVAPFEVAVVNRKAGDETGDGCAEELDAKLQAAGADPLYDDRDDRPGAKLAAIDLIGIPWQIVVGPRGMANGVVEVKNRRTAEAVEVSPDSALSMVMQDAK